MKKILIWISTLILLLGSVSAINIINKDLNTETVSHHGITITAPNEIVCDWRDPESDYKHCEVILEINNTNPISFPLTKFKIPFRRAVKKNKVSMSYSTDYVLYTEPVLNRTCYRNLNEEGWLKYHENKTKCYYNVTKKSFYEWKNGKPKKIPAETVVGLKLEFESPILIEKGRYLKNQFNFTLKGLDKEITLDPYISACAQLTSPGETYYLTADIIDSAVRYDCMSVKEDNITLDCQGHLIDGQDKLGSTGVYSGYFTGQRTTVRNCIFTDWGFAVMYYYGKDGLIENVTVNSIAQEGIEVVECNNITLTNVIAYNNSVWSTIMFEESSNCILTNSIVNSNSQGIFLGWYADSNIIANSKIENNEHWGVYLYNSHNNTLTNLTIRSNDIGICIEAMEANRIYNNLFNNTKNFHFYTLIYTNYWNTTKQVGTRIYSPGTEIGGNYWTNPAGNGYSDTCIDSDTDGFCDVPYNLAINNTDYLPLTMYQLAIPDLTLSQEDITFSPTFPAEGDIVTINATVHNIGHGNASNVTVQFLEGSITLTNLTINSINANASATVSTNWTAMYGNHTITIAIDPDDSIQELNESNNQASKDIEVISPTFKVLVVATYYQDESLSDIEQYESKLKESLENTKEYYLEQSYGHDHVWFSDPVYLQIGYSWTYPDLYPFDNYYSPPRIYADSTLVTLQTQKGIDPDEYDAVIGYQTDIQGDYRAVAFKDLNFAALNIDDNYGAFAHELGHALYGFDDFYATGIPLFENRGNIYDWGLMGLGDYLDPPAPIISFNKVLASWLNYSITTEGDFTIPVFNDSELIDIISINRVFHLTSLEDMSYNDDVMKVAGISDPGIDFSYDFIVEAREISPSGDLGVVIYQDHHGWFGSYLENLPPQNSSASHPESLPTLYEYEPNAEYYYNYSHIPTGLKFQYLGDTNPDQEAYEPEVKVGFNVSENINLTGVILNNLNIYNESELNTHFAPPPKPYCRNFTNCRAFLILTSTGEFKSEFICRFGKRVRINSIKVVNSLDNSECVITTHLPITNQIFTIEGKDCIPLDTELEHEWMTLDVEILYNTLSKNGTILEENLSESGKIIFTPAIAREKQGDSNTIAIAIIFLAFVIWLALLIKYRDNREVFYILLLALALILLFLWMWISQVGNLAPSASSKENLILPQFAPINISNPDIDLHAYTPDGKHVGMNYETGIYENQIPGAIASGDMIAEEWIFVPSNLDVRFVVDSHDVQQYLEEINSSETLITNYTIQMMEYGENPSVIVENGGVIIANRTISKPFNDTISPGEEKAVWDSAPTNIALNLPVNGSILATSEVTFVYTPMDESPISNCSLYIDGELNQTDYSIENGIQNNFTLTLGEGFHEWNVECTDMWDNSGFAISNYTLIIDRTSPVITIEGVADGESYNENRTLTYTVTDNLDSEPEVISNYPNGTVFSKEEYIL